MIHELTQTLYVNTPHGTGLVLFVETVGVNGNYIWTVANCADGKILHYDSLQITAHRNDTMDLNVENKKPPLTQEEFIECYDSPEVQKAVFDMLVDRHKMKPEEAALIAKRRFLVKK